MSLMMLNGRGGEAAPYQFPRSAPYNVPTYMHVPTYDGSNQAVHPDVIDFVAETGAPFQGYRFWMVMTPYPGFVDIYENPSFLVSNDGYRWAVPPGMTNPAYPTPGTGYNNDPDIVWDPSTSEMVLMFRTPANNYAPVVARSPDGITWPGTPTVLDWTPLDDWGLSPCILRDDNGTWHMWQLHYVTRAIWHWTAAAPEGPWGTATVCTGTPASAWHMNIVHAPGGGYHMLSTVNKNSAWLICSTSTNGTAWASSATKVVNVGSGGWDHEDTYRPALTLHEDGTKYRVWYSGLASNVWRIGYTHIPTAEWPSPPA